MKKAKLFALATVAALMAAACGGSDDSDTDSGRDNVATIGTIASTDCRYTVPGEQLRCGTLTVPEDYSKPNGRQVVLPFAVLASSAATPLADPVIYLQGGPGESTFTSLIELANLGPIRETREVILLEQRGSGAANPSLDCGGTTDPTELATCYGDLRAQGVDFEQYNNVNSARDFEMLRRALNIAQWNLFGVSYGTTLAMYVMRQFPDGVRSVVLDSPTAPGADIARADVTSQLDGLSRMFERCSADEACNARYPDLRNRFLETMSRLDAQPVALTGSAAQIIGDSLDSGAFVGQVIGGLAGWSLMDRMPALVDAVSRQEFERLPAILEQASSPATPIGDDLPPFASGLGLSIYCGELHYSRLADGPDNTAEQWPELVWQNLVPVYFVACKEGVWPIRPVDRKLLARVNSSVPTLILLGALDPLTSRAEAQRAAAGLRNGFSVTVPEATHSIAVNNVCTLDIMKTFVDKPATNPDQSCLSAIPKRRYRTDL
jgi:pimeloyl-ACP methyl ester carboxylesterase